jgi:predicted MFS family arabinose efflux permease
MADGLAEQPRTLWRPYQIYVVALLLLVTVCNYLDRIVLGVLQEPIKGELRLADWQLGLLNGPAFALLYSVAGIPVARLAERLNRSTLMAAATGAWSLLTALCATALGFGQLLLLRMGVGMAEGGCVPVSHSLLSDYFTPRQRGTVMSFVSAAPSLATILAPVIGGFAAEAWGWRTAFLIVAGPGVLLALLVKFTLKDPRVAAAAGSKAPPRNSFWTDLKWLLRSRAFVFIFIGGAFIGIGNGGVVAFSVSFLIRDHHLPLSAAGGVVGLTGLTGLIGAFLGGVLADRLSGKQGRSYVLIPAIGSLLAFLAYGAAFTVSDWALALPLLLGASVAYNLKNGPLYAAVQNLVPSTMRATGSAVFMVGATVIGSMVGPLLTGFLSDRFAGAAFPLGVFAQLCPGGKASAGAPAALVGACARASALGLKHALMTNAFAFILAAVFLALAAMAFRINDSDRAVRQ